MGVALTELLEAQPTFGQPLPVGPMSPEALAFLRTRRSASALTLATPGPSADEVDQILALATRVPDHGKLFPWRFIVIEGAAKAEYNASLEAIAANRPDSPKALAELTKLQAPPLTVAVVSRISEGKIPEWEQVLSAGAVCMNLLLAAAALGYGANWITGWFAYDPQALSLLRLQTGERIAGFVHIGTPTTAPLERVRPEISALVTHLGDQP
jgi:nitroreductase